MRILEVEWVDSMGEAGWRPAQEARRQATPTAMRHRTVGYLMEQTDSHLLLAMGHSDEGTEDTMLVHDTMQIPLVAVVKTKTLK